MERPSAQSSDPAPAGTRTLAFVGLPVASTRTVNLAVCSVLAVMGTLGVVGIDEWIPRVPAIALCLVFGLLQLLPGLPPSGRRLVLAGQTLVVAVLLSLPSAHFEGFGFLLYVLSVQAALLSSLRGTVAWLAGFWLIYSGAALWHGVPDPYVGIVFALGVFPFCGLVGYLLRATAVARAEGEETLERLRAAQSRIEDLAVTDERQRLARDLHDSVKQHVFAATMQVGAARAVLTEDPVAATAALDEADASAQRAGAELNVVIQELRPLDLEGHRLVDALRSHGAAWSRRSGMRVNVALEGDPRALLGADEALLRVTQEAMANAARHSGAEQIDATLTYRPTEVRLQIRDDGRGFVPDSTSPGLGLSSMRARVEDLGGRFDLTSAPGAGAQIDIRLEEP